MSTLIVKLPNWLGDILFSMDLLYSLGLRFTKLGLVTSDQHAPLFEIFKIPNAEVIQYKSESWPYLERESILNISKFQADYGLVLPNSFGSALLFKYAGVRNLYGYGTENRGILLKQSLPTPEHTLHQTEYYLNLLKLFNITPVHYPLTRRTQRERSVIIHPGTSKKERAWHMERFFNVAEHFQKKGWDVKIVSGEPLVHSDIPVLVKPTLKEFADMLMQCSLFIGNDSGPLHLAQQCGAAVVGIYGPGNPLVTGPRRISPAKVVYHNFPCSPCKQKFFHECDPSPAHKPYCIETISSAEVIYTAEQLLGANN
jgi:heptosyltransferase-2